MDPVDGPILASLLGKWSSALSFLWISGLRSLVHPKGLSLLLPASSITTYQFPGSGPPGSGAGLSLGGPWGVLTGWRGEAVKSVAHRGWGVDKRVDCPGLWIASPRMPHSGALCPGVHQDEDRGSLLDGPLGGRARAETPHPQLAPAAGLTYQAPGPLCE